MDWATPVIETLVRQGFFALTTLAVSIAWHIERKDRKAAEAALHTLHEKRVDETRQDTAKVVGALEENSDALGNLSRIVDAGMSRYGRAK